MQQQQQQLQLVFKPRQQLMMMYVFAGGARQRRRARDGRPEGECTAALLPLGGSVAVYWGCSGGGAEAGQCI